METLHYNFQNFWSTHWERSLSFTTRSNLILHHYTVTEGPKILWVLPKTGVYLGDQDDMLPPSIFYNIYCRRPTAIDTSINLLQKLPINPQTLLKAQFYTDSCYDLLCIYSSDYGINAMRLTLTVMTMKQKHSCTWLKENGTERKNFKQNWW